MSTGLIVVIVVVVVVLLAAFVFVVPRMRERARLRARERELEQRRSAQAGEHRQAAEQLTRRADEAEQRARIAEHEANKERAEADLREQRAEMHEKGLADHELISDDERDRFEGTSAVPADDREGESRRSRARVGGSRGRVGDARAGSHHPRDGPRPTMRTDHTRRPTSTPSSSARRRARETGSVPPHAALYMRERKELMSRSRPSDTRRTREDSRAA